MLNIRKLLFRTGDWMMTRAFLLGLLIPVLLEKFGILKLIGDGGNRIHLAFIFGGIGFLLLLPITAPLLGFGWLLVQISGLDSLKDVSSNS